MNKKQIGVITLLAFLYFITGKLSFLLSYSNKIVVMSIFFPEGISLAFSIIFGYFVFLGVFIGQFILAITSGLSFFPSLIISVINSIEVIIAYFILVKLGLVKKFDNIKELYLLFAVIFFILQPISALFGNLTLLSYDIISKNKFLGSLASWYMGNTIAQALITPPLVYMYFNNKKISFKNLAISITLGFFVGYLLFSIFKISYFSLLLGITLTVSLIFATFFDVFYVGLFLISLYISVLTSFKFGSFKFFTENVTENLININFYFFAHIFIVYTYAFLLKEKEQYLKQLEKLNASLEEKIKKAVEENQKQQELLHQQAKFAQMGELMSMIAHQWKQPLNTISLQIQTTYVKKQLGKLKDKDIENCFNETQEKIKSMSNMLHNFSQLFKPKSQKHIFPLEEIIQKVVSIVKPMLDEEKIGLDLDIEKNIKLNSYPEELGQVILNIITNAKDALKESVKEDKYIKIQAKKLDNKIQISIEDNAGGIPEEIIDKIFDPYFSTKSNVEKGLGLYMSKIIVENYLNGEIFAENTEQGAKFIILLKT